MAFYDSKGRLCVPNVDGLKERILDEAHSSQYSIHPVISPASRWLHLRLYMVDGVVLPSGGFDPGEAKLYGTYLVKDALKKVKLIQEHLRTAQSRQKSYTDQKVRELSFMVGDNVLLKVSPMKGIIRFGKKGKFSPRFIGPFEVLRRVGEVAYDLALPPNLLGVHPVFHVSMLRRYHTDFSHVLDFNTIQLDERLGYEEEPIAIVARQDRQLRSKRISTVKVQWRGQPVEKATWESEEDMRSIYPHLLSTPGINLNPLRTNVCLRDGECNYPTCRFAF
ncbi:uncharacterized protein [Nicotiana sylvestris]|uniref:uncharacterized protein n=1 Tax=Nicotiana sylvestris TaxID=4096 RepID=UPI00388C7F05